MKQRNMILEGSVIDFNQDPRYDINFQTMFGERNASIGVASRQTVCD